MTENHHESRQWPLWATLLVAMLLTLTPSPDWYDTLFPGINLRPNWVLLVSFYWAIALPQTFSVGRAWIIGILLDIVSGGLLGRHALGLVAAIWISQKFYLQLRQFPIGQQAFVISLLCLVQQLTLLWIDGTTGSLSEPLQYFVPILSTTALWPVCFPLLRKLRITLHVR